MVTYSSVVSRDSVRIMLTIAALNDLSLKAADIQNAFLTAPNLEKNWICVGPEFGDKEGNLFIVRCVLYGLKSASALFRAHMAEKLDKIGFKPTLGDPDVWLRPTSKLMVRHTTSTYWLMLAVYWLLAWTLIG